MRRIWDPGTSLTSLLQHSQSAHPSLVTTTAVLELYGSEAGKDDRALPSNPALRKCMKDCVIRQREESWGRGLDGGLRFSQPARRRKSTIVSTGGLRSGSWTQADCIRSQRSSVSPNSVASDGRGGRSLFPTLIITARSCWHDENGMVPVNTWPWDMSRSDGRSDSQVLMPYLNGQHGKGVNIGLFGWPARLVLAQVHELRCRPSTMATCIIRRGFCTVETGDGR